MTEEASYRISYRRPDKNPFKSSVSGSLAIEGHYPGVKIRRNLLKKGDIAYQSYCSCGWQDKRIDRRVNKEVPNWIPQRMLDWQFAGHIDKINEQGKML